MCYIRINTQEIRSELEKMGYVFYGFDNITNKNICLSHKLYSCVGDTYIETTDPHISWSINRIDCGCDVEKFLRLAKNKISRNK